MKFPTKWEGRVQQVSMSQQVRMQQKELRKSCREDFAAEADFSKHKWESRHLLEGESDTKKTLLCRSSVEGLEHFAGGTQHLTELEFEVLLSS